jgi:uncharacterized membrane protein
MAESKSVTGLKKETLAAVACLFSPTVAIPLIIYFIEKDSFVRFYATQSALAFVSAAGLASVLFLILPIAGIVWITWFVVWLMMVYKSWQGEEWEIPVFGKIAKALIAKLKI